MIFLGGMVTGCILTLVIVVWALEPILKDEGEKFNERQVP